MGLLQRKMIAFIFLLIVAVPLLSSLKFILEESLIMLEVEEKMHTEKLVTISIPKKDVVWIKAGKEIMIQGELFDIKKMESDIDAFYFTGYFDTEETELFSLFKKYTEKATENDASGKSVIKFLFPPVFNACQEVLCEINWEAVSNQYAQFDESLPVSPCRSLLQPPRLSLLHAA